MFTTDEVLFSTVQQRIPEYANYQNDGTTFLNKEKLKLVSNQAFDIVSNLQLDGKVNSDRTKHYEIVGA